MFFDVLTLFPEMFDGILSQSILKRAIDRELISVTTDNIRDYSTDKHRSVDDAPYGGAPGMVMKPEPLAAAIIAAKKRHGSQSAKVIFMTPQGRPLTHQVVEELSCEDGLILLCGHYKGIDHRIREKYVDDEISLGDFVLSGGEIAAMSIVDAVSRLVPGVLGNKKSAGRDSHFNGLLSAPIYTRPELFEGMAVPSVLLDGNHKHQETWDQEMAEKMTRDRRPDLWNRYCDENKKI